MINRTLYNYKEILLLTLLFFSLSFFSNAQHLNELKEKKKLIEKEIDNITNLIAKTEKESSNSLTNIRLTKKRIELKNSLIKQIDRETESVNNQISIRKSRIDSLNSRIRVIKEEYTKIVIYSQKNRLGNKLLLQIFASSDFNQAYKRVKFYQQVLDYKHQIVENYKASIKEIKEETNKLNDNINQLSQKQEEKEKEIFELKKDESSHKKKVQILNQKKKQLIAELEEQKRVTQKLTDEIRKLIAEEVRKELENKNKSKSNSINVLTLSNNFKENVGKFNLPVQNGIITGVYGESVHPVLKEVKVKNNGIDITVSSNSLVFSIFKGEIRKIIKIPGSNLAVIVRHGNYLSVYSNLSVVHVKVGQEINSYHKIGEIYLQKGEETAILHFELWNESKTVDPLKWLKN